MTLGSERNRDRSGRYADETRCDNCGRPAGVDHYTDEEVCGGTDGPGFYLCTRKRCAAKYQGLGVEERRALYTAQRAVNDGERGPAPVTSSLPTVAEARRACANWMGLPRDSAEKLADQARCLDEFEAAVKRETFEKAALDCESRIGPKSPAAVRHLQTTQAARLRALAAKETP